MRKPYATVMTDEQWEIAQPLIPPPRSVSDGPATLLIIERPQFPSAIYDDSPSIGTTVLLREKGIFEGSIADYTAFGPSNFPDLASRIIESIESVRASTEVLLLDQPIPRSLLVSNRTSGTSPFHPRRPPV